mmetsp:Transcript_15985/g.43590  ORF Transcript_15985/g.43590 Transcript_15985/m.43590 type:complete len:392 (+) Transcript_15985:179-1354(+)
MSASQSLWNALKPQLRYISRDRRAGGAGNLTVGCAGFASPFSLGAASALTAAWLAFFAFAFFFFRARRFAALVIGFFSSFTTGFFSSSPAAAAAEEAASSTPSSPPSALVSAAVPPVSAATVLGSRPCLGGSTIITSASRTASRHTSSAREITIETLFWTLSGSRDLLASNVSAAAPTISTHRTDPPSSSSPCVIVAAMDRPMGPAPAYSSDTAASLNTKPRIRASAASNAPALACANDAGVSATAASPCPLHANRSPLRCVQCGDVIVFPTASFQLTQTECTRMPFGGSISPGESALLLFQSLSASAIALGADIGPDSAVGAGAFHTSATCTAASGSRSARHPSRPTAVSWTYRSSPSPVVSSYARMPAREHASAMSAAASLSLGCCTTQ